MIYFISDTHFNHRKIIEHCNRPYETVEQMDQGIIDAWNSRVGPKDTVYHLGDFGFLRGSVTTKSTILRGLVDKLVFQDLIILPGNHDKGVLLPPGLYGLDKDRTLTVHESSLREIKIDGTHVVLCHYPMEDWNRSRHGSYHLHGHCHGSLGQMGGGTMRRLDVGVDAPIHGREPMSPISWDEVHHILSQVNLREEAEDDG